MKSKVNVSYRDIAKMLVKAMPLKGQEFGNKVNEYTDIIKAMPTEAKVALKSAYIFSAKVPREEREDMFQDLCLAVLELRTKDEKLGYTVARCDWKNWWSKYKIRQHYSLNSIVKDEEGNEIELAELIVGEAEFELKMDSKIDAERIWDKLPKLIKSIVQRRLLGYALNNTERQRLSRYVRQYGAQLLINS